MWRSFASLLVILVTAVAGGVRASVHPRLAQSNLVSGAYNYTWKTGLQINATGDVVLSADAFLPTPQTAGEKFPVLIFANSWGCPQIEYLIRAANFATQGYVAIEYETRGWWSSQGIIDTAGPLDRADGSSVIDFVVSQAAAWNADTTKIAFVGISYGAGISLMMAGFDSRVTTAVALSGWNNKTYMLYGNESPNKEVHGLIDAAKDVGRPAPALESMVTDLFDHRNATEMFTSFANPRSPEMFLDQLNARQPPLFISSNFMDRLFRPEYMMDFVERLQGRKMVLFNQGGHAEPEGIGLLIHDNYIWNHVVLWVDYWLRNDTTNGILDEPTVQMQQGSLESATHIDYTGANKSVVSLFLQPRHDSIGNLTASAAAPSTDSTPIHYDTHVKITSAKKFEKDIIAGIPYIQNLLQPVTVAAVYRSEPLTPASAAAGLNVCGTPTVDLTFDVSCPSASSSSSSSSSASSSSSSSPSADNWQFYTFLYDVSPDNQTAGSLLSFGSYTHYEAGPTAGPVAAKNADGSWTVRGAPMHTLCQVLPPGHSVAIAIVLASDDFGPANDDESLTMKVRYENSAFHLPVINAPN
jgi:dienelactone hydrolase